MNLNHARAYTLRQCLFDWGLRPSAIESEAKRLRLVIAGKLPPTVLDRRTYDYARVRGQI